MSSNINNNNTIKHPDDEETTKNKLIENVLESIGFDTMGSEEEQNQNSYS